MALEVDGLQIWRKAADVVNKQSRTADMEWLSVGLTTPHLKKSCYEMLERDDLDVGGRIILIWILDKMGVLWPGCIWLRIGTGGGLL
jgi:hypothetical protein